MTGTPVPPEVLTALAATRPAAACTTALRSAVHARRMLLLKALLVRVERHPLPSAVRRRFDRDWALLVGAEHIDGPAVRAVLDYPMTGAWLAEALAAPDSALAAHLSHFSGVALAAAVRAGCPAEGTLTVEPGALTLPGLGVLRCPSGRVRVGGTPGRLRVDGDAGGVVLTPCAGPAAAPGWSPLETLPGSTAVLDDLDPYGVPARGIGPRALRAAERSTAARRTWRRRWREALALLSVTDRPRAAEITALLRALVPLAPSAPGTGALIGATLRAAPGAVLVQLPDDPAELAESLVHETHHSKLAALDEVVPLTRPDGTAVHHVGWRTDPRPLPAVLQGAYAHLALTDLWWRVRRDPAADPRWRDRAEEQFEAHRKDVEEALNALRESGELTFAGREFVQNMSRHHVRLGTPARHVP
ncbi:aKG-HExxH-type peptide beta-hydroxylase [Streptomyces sp. NPDC053367]|uniref:aKG-HExxH-type peptide beta-hydroxylase n=1 Tax=Streptomyces sp. NPDC053367 TaxID=3365700 RepID=UPI0037D117CC